MYVHVFKEIDVNISPVKMNHRFSNNFSYDKKVFFLYQALLFVPGLRVYIITTLHEYTEISYLDLTLLKFVS